MIEEVSKIDYVEGAKTRIEQTLAADFAQKGNEGEKKSSGTR